MQQTSLEIIRNLPHYTDADLRKLIGMLCLDMYGKEVGAQVARFVYAERDRSDALMNEIMEAVEEALAIKGQGFQGSFMGVQIFRSAYVQNSSPAGNKVGAMMSAGAVGYAIGTPRPLAGAGAEIRPAGTPVVVAFERDESKALTEIVGHLYCGAAITEDEKIVKIVTDA